MTDLGKLQRLTDLGAEIGALQGQLNTKLREAREVGAHIMLDAHNRDSAHSAFAPYVRVQINVDLVND